LEIAGLTCSAPDMGRPGRRERCRLDRTSRVSVSITDMVRSVLEGAQGFRTQTGLRRHSNQPLLAGGNSAGKEFGEARDWAGVFGDTRRFRGTETAPSRVSGRQSRGKSKTIPTTPGNRNRVGLRGGPGRTNVLPFCQRLRKSGPFFGPFRPPDIPLRWPTRRRNETASLSVRVAVVVPKAEWSNIRVRGRPPLAGAARWRNQRGHRWRAWRGVAYEESLLLYPTLRRPMERT
jgi:hypothetical protein